MMTLAEWLAYQLRERGLSQQAASMGASVSPSTISEMLNRGHVPRIETLFRLADFFEVPRERILRIAARMSFGDEEPPEGDEDLIRELVEEFRQVPDEWKIVAVRQIEMFRHLAEMPTVRFIGDEDEDDDPDQTPND
jgi:transcriptional regulator with XRE-family HTH domain